MNRIIVLILALFFCTSGLAMEVMVENYSDYADIWLLLPYDLFIFAGNEDSSVYQISTQIENYRGKQAAVNELQLEIPRRPWLQGSAIPVHNQYKLGPGSYRLNLILRNPKLGDKRSFSRDFKIGTQATEIGLAYLIATREGFSYVPEALDLSEPDSVMLKMSFSIPARLISVFLDEQKLDYPYPQSPWEIDLKSVAELDSLASLKLSVTEGNIRYNMEALLYHPWFSFNARYSLKDQLAQIRYIASQNDWLVLRKVPKDKIAEAIESYWRANDPSPGTLRNESRETFSNRVLRADELFTIHKRLRGWRSDRGRIYIKFGEPEQIVNDAFPSGKAPSIRWHYFRLKRQFIFTDERGFGQYTLRNKDEEYLED